MSKSRTLFETTFLALREREGYVYAHMTRAAGQLVALMPYRLIKHELQYLARVEVCPAHKLEPDLYAITGGFDPGDTALRAAQRELREEAGYSVAEADFLALGTVYQSKQADTVVSLFAVDVTDAQQGAIEGDGTRWETSASVQWVSYQRGLQIADPLFITAMARLRGEQNGD